MTMKHTANILDHDQEPNLDEGDSMICVWGVRPQDADDPTEVFIKYNWSGGGELVIPCDTAEDAQSLIDAIGIYADRATVHLVFRVDCE